MHVSRQARVLTNLYEWEPWTHQCFLPVRPWFGSYGVVWSGSWLAGVKGGGVKMCREFFEALFETVST